jgi:type IV pilus assembly protein PilY1
MTMTTGQLLHRTLRYAFASAIALAANAYAGYTDIAQQPLAQPASNVPPNIMLILDDSGSMIQQYTPDYLGRHFGGSNRLCLDSKDDNGSIDTNLDNCEAGDPPLMTPDLNTQYYNPEIRYYPAVNYDGSSKPSMDASNTSNWTAVPTDGVSVSTLNTFRKDTFDMNGNGSTVTTVDLTTNYPDRVWCKSQSDSATGSNCRINGAYSYPDATYGYGRTTGGNIKYITGAPYYYRIVPTWYCTDQTLTVCIPATTATGSYTVPAPVRYCDSTTLANCQAKFQGSFTRPQYTGFVTTTLTGGSPATATITVKNPQSDSYAGSITAIYVKGLNILSGTTVNEGTAFTASQAATDIKNAINSNTSTNGGYTACVGTGCSPSVSSNVVVITAPSSCASAQTCSTWNSASVNVASTGTPVSPASTTFIISNTSSGDTINTFSVNGLPLISSAILCQGNGGICTGNGTNQNNYMASALAAAINANTGTTGFTASYTNGTSSTNTTVTVTAPSGSGSQYNGAKVSASAKGMSAGDGSLFDGGVTNGDIETSASAFANGVDPNNGRLNVGQFVRTSITPYQAGSTVAKTFTKYPARTDCAGTSCTYAEEMTNFANWYAYYRMRDTMAKTAIGRAFLALTSQYRVGFITINPGPTDWQGNFVGPVQSDRYLKVDAFDSTAGGQKDQWYQHVYGTDSNGSTPLREALSRVGRYYGNVTSGINSGMDASPIQYACQPSYAIVMTDGYWNGSAGQDLTGNPIGNQDNVDAGYSTRAVGAYDGGLSGSTNTLADVAMYYYKTDLRTDLADHVPTTQKDTASFQHMVTFTIGLGLAGQLNYDQNYESETSGDFFDIKQGSKNWPVPAADSETALDDLWHAAVNGRGVFFSARNPVDVANGLADTINSFASRVGAGAAAATSNLQPVAGDNFAFTAQYQTVSWTGDLEARTINLTDGFVAYRALWSASTQLDQRTAADRHIYTFDSTDNSAPTTGNGNLLKAFCWPGAYATGLYPACGPNEAELNSTEMGYFNPLTLPQSTPWPTDGSGRNVSASAQNLVDFLRGDTSNYNQGGTATTDLYRNRLHLLGDIVDAQPAYVKAAPFGYDTGSYAGTDPYYQTFKQSTDGTTGTRKGTVFAAANDGMLHAFETDPDNNPYYQTAGIDTATTTDDAFTGTLDTNPVSGEGAERWAYIPSMVLPQLKNLASIPYSHQYFVDGSPTIGDVCFGHTTSTPCASASNWHTILVAGLNAGGRGYYALDITDPDNPKALWELKGGAGTTCLTDAQANSGTYFQDCNIGLTFGNPIITKRMSDGKWVVLLTSGHNNVFPGNGQGYLYVVDAQTGAILNRIGTGVGCDGLSSTAPCTAGTVDPSGLSRINAWVDNAFLNNTTQRVYAGDLKGNVWRFQLDPGASGYLTAVRMTTLTDPGGTPQPITTRPELALINNMPVVYIATGKLLGTTDTSTTQVQSIYAFADDLTGTPFTIRGNSAFVQQTLTATGPDTRTATSNAVDWTTNKGWYVDLPDSGERANVDPILQLGTLVVPTNVPSNDSCVAGGYGWVNFLDYKSGSYVTGATDNATSMKIGASLVVGVNVVQLPGGNVKTIVTTADNQQITQDTPVSPPSIVGRRVSWRELIRE